MVPRTLWESRDQSRETGLDCMGQAAGKNGADFRGETARVCQAEGTGLAPTREHENRRMPHCAPVASHSRTSLREAETET